MFTETGTMKSDNSDTTFNCFENLGAVTREVVQSRVQLLSSKPAKKILRIHENGFYLLQNGTSTTISYEHLDEYCFRKIRVYSANPFPYIFSLKIKSNQLGDTAIIKWSEGSTSQGAASEYSIDYDALHLHISTKVKENMAAKLKSIKKISWGNSMHIQDDGIEVNKKWGVLFSKTSFFRWSDIGSINICEGNLHLSIASKNETFKISFAEPNMLAGYFLVNELLETHRGSGIVKRQDSQEISNAITEHFYDDRDSRL